MRRRNFLASASSIAAATLVAGCSSGGSGGDNGETSTSSATNSCVPPTDDLSQLLPSGEERFSKVREESTGLSIGTDTYVIGRYETSDGAVVDLLVAEYSSPDAASSSVSAVRSAGENAVMGTLVDSNYVVAVDAPSESVGRALVRESEVSCVGKLSFSSSQTTTDVPFELGEVVWAQAGGDAAKSNAVNVDGLTASDPSQYTVEIRTEAGDTVSPIVTTNALVTGSQIHRIQDGSVVAELPVSSVSSPVYHNETIVAVTEDGKIRGIDAQSRQEKWNYLPRDGVFSLAAGGGFVFAVVGSVTVVAIDIQSGEKAWEREGQSLHGVVDEKVFIGGAGNLGVNIGDGSVAYEVGDDIRRVSSEGSVYVGNLTRVNAADGSVVWQKNIENAGAADGQYVYSPDSGEVTAYSVEDGSEAWSTEAGTYSIAVDANNLYASSSGRTFVLDKSTGEEQARYAVGGRDSLRVGAGTLVAVSGNQVTVLRG